MNVSWRKIAAKNWQYVLDHYSPGEIVKSLRQYYNNKKENYQLGLLRKDETTIFEFIGAILDQTESRVDNNDIKKE